MPAVHLREGKKMDNKGQAYWYGLITTRFVKFCTKDVNTIYHGSVWHVSKDGGKTWVGSDGDDHELWIDPKDPNHWIHLDDYDAEQSWKYETRGSAAIAYVKKPSSLFQTYGCGYDMRKLYWVMCNAQDNGAATLFPTQSVFRNDWRK
jgi:hypothetical protein